MKIKNQITSLLTAIVLIAGTGYAADTELSLSLLAKLGVQGSGQSGSSEQFSITFGAYNGNSLGQLFATATSYGTDVQGFNTWYGANSRSIYTWSGVQGNLINNDDAAYYRNFSIDNTVDSYAGAPKTSIFSSQYDNSVFAFISTGSGASLELALIDLGLDWADPAWGTAGGVLSDTVVLNAGQSAVVYAGGVDRSGQGLITTTTNVPEPSASALLLVGAVALGAVRRIRKNV